MNDVSHDNRPPQEPPGLDPELLRLFDEAPTYGSSEGRAAPMPDEAFVLAVFARLRRARRVRLLARSIPTAGIIISGAFMAPYVAQATLTIMASFAIYPAACACAALIAWRIAQRSN